MAVQTTAQTLFTLATLHTVSGSSLAILLVVQLIKGVPFVKKMPTQCLALIIGILLFFVTSPIPTSLGDLTVIILNGLLSASTAIGGWHMINGVVPKDEKA